LCAPAIDDELRGCVIDRPTNPEAFQAWSTEATCGAFHDHVEKWYSANQNNLLTTVTDSAFLAELPRELSVAAESYGREKKTKLFAFDRTPKLALDRKTYKAFLEKLFRANVLDNERFPEAPEGGWVSLNNAFERIDDIVRTTIVVAYADGPEFVVRKIQELASRKTLTVRVKDHAQEKGYYAHHFYVHFPLNVSSPTDAARYPVVSVPIELQVTTELQGTLREITHWLYERERLSGGPRADWKTQFGSGRFRAAYMAHSLRFIEAMVVDLRDGFTKDETR
jgi:hypothetical protein